MAIKKVSKQSKMNKAPRKFVNKWGAAKIDIIANKDQIQQWLDLGFTQSAIYKTLIDQGIIDGVYTYMTFLRNLKAVFAVDKSKSTKETQKTKSEKSECYKDTVVKDVKSPEQPKQRQIIRDEKKSFEIIRSDFDTRS